MAQVVQAHPPTSPSAVLTPALRQGDHERLFQLLETEGPAPNDFMLFVSDPVVGRESIFEDEDDS